MLKPACLYVTELRVKFLETTYNVKYKYFYFGTSSNIPTIDDNR